MYSYVNVLLFKKSKVLSKLQVGVCWNPVCSFRGVKASFYHKTYKYAIFASLKAISGHLGKVMVTAFNIYTIIKKLSQNVQNTAKIMHHWGGGGDKTHKPIASAIKVRVTRAGFCKLWKLFSWFQDAQSLCCCV